ncbi:MAG TPA: peptidoglycan DD-metalloendopeptidase family protein [Alphaproteobacteria bacterium]|nr:peptidoglycan DD-metalloendopeptidase family protein [Alphaproteobacteria bacterium]
MKQNLAKLITIFIPILIAYGLVFFVSQEEAADELDEVPQVIAQAEQETEESAKSEEGPYDETLTIKEGDTLASILSRLGIPSTQAHEAITALSKVFNPKDLKVDQEVYVIYDAQSEGENYDLKFLRLRGDFDHHVELVRTGGGLFQATKYKKELKHQYVDINGDIKISLYADALRAGASPKMLYDMIKAFSFDVDFQRDIQPGASFSLFYDTYKDEESGHERPGELLYAKLVIDKKPYEIYRFQPGGGVPGYYTSYGEAVQKALLRTPIDGARINSGFGNRKHPIKGYTKMHKGVDFGAPHGTPIMAAGDGVVERCNKYGGYGNYICIRHDRSTKTAYAHLCRFAKGLCAGRKIRQGQVIGYVGTTGNSTGAHLHFELLINGKHVNPQKITQLPKSKLVGKVLNEFKAFMAKIEKMKNERSAVENRVAESRMAE